MTQPMQARRLVVPCPLLFCGRPTQLQGVAEDMRVLGRAWRKTSAESGTTAMSGLLQSNMLMMASAS